MIAAAAFAHMPWENVPFDSFEDLLHSAASGMVGFSFIAGVLSVSVGRGPGQGFARAFDWLAMVAAVAISLLIFNVEDIAGLVQRVMFGIAYLWYGLEAIRAARATASTPPPDPDAERAAAAHAAATR